MNDSIPEPSSSPSQPEASPPQQPEARRAGDSWQAKAGLALIVLCAGAAMFWPRSEVREAPTPGMLVDGGGQTIPLATRMAPVTLLHFWSTWCPPCLDEVPSVLRLADDYGSRHDFALVMIAVADDNQKVKTFLGDDYERTLFDPDWKVTKRYGTDKLPETHLVIDGKIVDSFIGATNWDDPGVRQRLDAAIAGKAQPTSG